MSSVRNMFEQKGGSVPLPTITSTKNTTSGWNQPNTPVSPHDLSDNTSEEHKELPPSGMNRSLVSQFSQFKSKPSPINHKPTRAEYDATPSNVECIVQSHDRVIQGQTTDSNIEENKHEDQLPEQGTTQNLLAQWRNKEQTCDISKSKPITHRSYSIEREHYPRVKTPDDQTTVPQYEDTQQLGLDVIRPTGTFEKKDEELPPPSTTKILLAKFQTLQAEAKQTQMHSPQPRKVNRIYGSIKSIFIIHVQWIFNT